MSKMERAGALGLEGSAGTECNRVKVGGTTTLLGDPKFKPEKPYTIITFPGGDVEISRTETGAYWVHVAVRKTMDTTKHKPGRIVDARIDFQYRYDTEINEALQWSVAQGDISHLAFLIQPPETPE